MILKDLIKIAVAFRLYSWGLGILLSIFSWLFEKDAVFTIAGHYNTLISLISFIPITLILILLDLIISREKVLKHILGMILMIAGFFIYQYIYI